MFTGIVTDVGEVLALFPEGDLRIRIATGYDVTRIDTGASIACEGVCLTVIATGTDPRAWFDVQVSAETLSKTNLSAWTAGTRVNLERALRVGDELGGHIVSGHVDGLARVEAVVPDGDSQRVTFSVPPHLAGFIATKGSVALNGTSLTVNAVDGTQFWVNFIPHTQAVTTWGRVLPGDMVNLEIDTMARYVARLREWGQ
jgi:riboflavin synthase